MAQLIQDSPKKKHRSSSGGCFPLGGCFGFSKSPAGKAQGKNKTKYFSSGGCFSWPTKSLKKSVPVDGDEHDDEDAKLHHRRKESFRIAKLSKKFSANKLPNNSEKTQNGSVAQRQIPAAAAATGGGDGDEPAGHGRADYETKDEDQKPKKMNLGNGKHSTVANEPAAAATYKRGIFRRNSWSQPATTSSSSSELKKSEIIINHQQAGAVLSHSASMPAAGEEEQPSEERKDEDYAGGVGKFDQLVGMSIIVVTLIIMIIWGKLCAILCTSAWLYFYPILLLRSNSNTNKIDHHHHPPVSKNRSKSLDLVESKRSNKKVVFEGFLERSHRAN